MRRHDLDWLRVLVFALLIFYHVGMLFVPWDFHIKNNKIYSGLILPMWFLNQWRLPILFVISGMGTYYALRKRTSAQFAFERLKRLFLPLVFGIIFIIPPQIYIERLHKAQFDGNYLDFFATKAFTGIYPEGNISWNHLWFLTYLFLFSIVLIPIFIYFIKNENNPIKRVIKQQIKKPLGLYLFIIPLYFTEAFMEPRFPVTHALIGDWFTILNYTLLFLYGFLLISVKDKFWETVEKYRNRFLIGGMLGFTLMVILVVNFEDSYARHFTEASIKVFNLWSWILAIFGFGARYLNQNSKILNYANQAVYPFYILHQTVMIIIAYFIIELNWRFESKATVLILGTFFGSWILYEYFIRRSRLLRPLFGLTKKAKS